MAKRRTTIGKFSFDGVEEAIAHIRAIIQRTPNEQPLQGEDAAFVAALFARHPEYSERTKNRVIMYFTVSNPQVARDASTCNTTAAGLKTSVLKSA